MNNNKSDWFLYSIEIIDFFYLIDLNVFNRIYSLFFNMF